MKSLYTLFAIAVVGLSSQAQASTIVNLNALSSDCTSVWLNAGSYDVSVIGTAQGGQYNGWDFATQNYGQHNATPAPNDWVESFAMTLSNNTSTYFLKGDPSFASASAALSAYQHGMLYSDSGVVGNNTSTLDTVAFTLAKSGEVSFSIPDYLFCDNWGGVSLAIDPAKSAMTPSPEPATFGLMGLVLSGGLVAFRRRQVR
jgi:hypothetical protein